MSSTPILKRVLGVHRMSVRQPTSRGSAVAASRACALLSFILLLFSAATQAQGAPAGATSGAAASSAKASNRTDAGAAAPVADAGSADAGSSDAGAPPPPLLLDAGAATQPDAGPAPAATCAEHVPEGKERPGMRQRIASRGLAGYAVTLIVTVDHGKAEKLFPSGFRLNRTSEEAAEFLKSGFAFPDADGGAGPELSTEQTTAGATTSVSLHFVALPPKGGRQVLTLPAVPITIARANGDLITLCTQPETLTIDPPIANTPNPQPHPNPPPRQQREVWESAKIAAATALIALVVGALVASLLIWLKRRPKPVPPPPPPRPPWELALEELHDLRQRQLINQERYDEHFDEVCLILRRYLGGRYGIGEQLGDAGALESTTEEILRVLSRILPPIPVMLETESFLREADLVKFAKASPGSEQCEAALSAIEQIVMRTVPKRPTNQPGQDAGGSEATRAVDVLVSGAASSRAVPSGKRNVPNQRLEPQPSEAAKPTATSTQPPVEEADPVSSAAAVVEPPDSAPPDSAPPDSAPPNSQPPNSEPGSNSGSGGPQ